MISVQAQTQSTPIPGAATYLPPHYSDAMDYTHAWEAQTAYGSDGHAVASLADMVGALNLTRGDTTAGTATYKAGNGDPYVTIAQAGSGASPSFLASLSATTYTVMLVARIGQFTGQALYVPGYILGPTAANTANGFWRVWNGTANTDPQTTGVGTHITVVTCNGSQLDLWSDGTRASGIAANYGPSQATNMQFIGFKPVNSSTNTGAMSFVAMRYWPRVLSITEIAAVTAGARTRHDAALAAM